MAGGVYCNPSPAQELILPSASFSSEHTRSRPGCKWETNSEVISVVPVGDDGDLDEVVVDRDGKKWWTSVSC